MIKFRKNSENGNCVWKIILTVVITALITYFLTMNIVLRSYLNASGLTYLSTKMTLIKQKLDATCIHDLNEDEMLEYALKGYVAGVNDRYTEYLTKEEMDDLLESTTGTYIGIGVYLTNNTKDNTIVIVSVIEGSVAEDAGLQAGDIIKEVDNVPYTGKDLDAVSQLFKGEEEGTEVKILISRNEEDLQFLIKRSNIRVRAVSSKMLGDNVGYIRISTFNEGTAEEFKSAYENLKNQGMNKLVLDLRYNGGGLVSESIKVANTMVDKGNTVLITKSKSQNEKIEKNNSNPIVDVPVVILINESTASASEILAGALRDDCEYKIVGKNSYGKGVIQTIFAFADGSGIKITTDEYFTPNHNKINEVGIKPDFEVDVDAEWKNIVNIPFENDTQLQKAIEELK